MREYEKQQADMEKLATFVRVNKANGVAASAKSKKKVRHAMHCGLGTIAVHHVMHPGRIAPVPTPIRCWRSSRTTHALHYYALHYVLHYAVHYVMHDVMHCVPMPS